MNHSIDKEAILELAALLREADLHEIEIDNKGYRLRVARHADPVHTGYVPVHAPSVPVLEADNIASKSINANSPGAVVSPMVGNVYLSPKPGSPVFVTKGMKVEKGQTLLIVEAMKVMNPIPSPVSGIVQEILVTDGQPVEYNDVLMVIS
jgi:acetyl-CoA carboxylase biotin carboxyl carrier protein